VLKSLGDAGHWTWIQVLPSEIVQTGH